MKIAVEIRTDNAAFEDRPSTEVARILRVAATKIDGDYIEPGDQMVLYDINGNKVGALSVKE